MSEEGFKKLAEASNGRWDGVDAVEYVKEQRYTMTTGEKMFKIVDGDISDGYHTFDELYEHRYLLFLALLKTEFELSNPENCNSGIAFEPKRILDHYSGWDLIYAYTADNKQISYHVPSRLRPLCSFIPIDDEHDYCWDGHTSYDVIKRLKEFLSL